MALRTIFWIDQSVVSVYSHGWCMKHSPTAIRHNSIASSYKKRTKTLDMCTDLLTTYGPMILLMCAVGIKTEQYHKPETLFIFNNPSLRTLLAVNSCHFPSLYFFLDRIKAGPFPKLY